jgi:hypothetical protein
MSGTVTATDGDWEKGEVVLVQYRQYVLERPPRARLLHTGHHCTSTGTSNTSSIKHFSNANNNAIITHEYIAMTVLYSEKCRTDRWTTRLEVGRS